MKTADLYIRVSTDEQADKGYSQRNQEEALRRYCEINSIAVRKVIFEDYSAKTFIRPQWKTMLSEYRRRKGCIDLLLFTKWDRFSRNAGDAYQMINMLRNCGIDPQAVEQPLDLSIPENKMMMAFYLAAPEVENDRRALNVTYGMRRAKKEGRWMSSAPVGYKNITSEDGKKFIAPLEPQASHIKWAFEQIAKGTHGADLIRKELNLKGFICSRANFYNAIRNPVYCGKIFIPKFRDDEAQLVQGQHQPIISEALFYEVQDVLDGLARKKRVQSTNEVPSIYPLRGHLTCPKCGKTLTSSGSKGATQRYHYYHCHSSCGYRQRATLLNDRFDIELKRYAPAPGSQVLVQTVVKDLFEKQFSKKTSGTKMLLDEIGKLNEKVSKARELLLNGDIEPADFKQIKTDAEQKILRLEMTLADQQSNLSDTVTISKYVEKATSAMFQFYNIYRDGDMRSKRRVISSIYPEKLWFDGKNYRTTRLNSAFALIYSVGKGFSQIKNRNQSDFSLDSGMVAPTRIELVSKV